MAKFIGFKNFFNCDSSKGPLSAVYWIGLFVSILTPLFVCLTSLPYFNSFAEIQPFVNLLISISCFKFIACFIGLFMIRKQTRKKGSVCLYIFVLIILLFVSFIVLIGCLQLDVDLSKSEKNNSNIAVHAIRDFYSTNEQIPCWMKRIQEEKKCCGLNGPLDWKKFIYPAAKKPYEDVPESCCLSEFKVTGCNIFLQELNNSSILGDWIYQEGCRPSIESALKGFILTIIFGIIILMISISLMIGVYIWLSLFGFDNMNSKEQNIRLNQLPNMMDIEIQSIESMPVSSARDQGIETDTDMEDDNIGDAINPNFNDRNNSRNMRGGGGGGKRNIPFGGLRKTTRIF